MKKVALLSVLMMSVVYSFGQAPALPGDPLAGGGVGVPLDGGVLLGILAGAGAFVAFVKRNKRKKE